GLLCFCCFLGRLAGRGHKVSYNLAVLGDGDSESGYTLRLYDKPLVSWIWGGASLMALGGLLAMARGRKREMS
ncbi:MAG: hypothetical protein EBU10_01720, partial [Alphaproteobacteria bacterium]|nr:hypothetical protein [Alphaproteobacteria bacterium]